MKEIENAENKENLTLEKFIDRAYQEDFLSSYILQLLVDESNYSKDLNIANFAIVNSKLHYRDRLYISDYHIICLHLCCFHHNFPYADHLEIGITYEQLY